MKIQILSNQQTQAMTKGGKPYNFLELSFKNLNTGKVEGKKLMPFGETKAAFESLSTAGPQEFFEITTVKNTSTGYWDWTEAVRTEAGTTSPQQFPAKVAGGTTTSPKSTYETPEERAAKQVYIVRQSSISSAIAMLTPGSKSALDVDAVLAVAAQLEDFVFGKDKQIEPVTGAQALADMSDDVPF